MAELKVRINCDSAAFYEDINGEVSKILENLANQIRLGNATGMYQNITDSNMNIIGTYRLQNNKL